MRQSAPPSAALVRGARTGHGSPQPPTIRLLVSGAMQHRSPTLLSLSSSSSSNAESAHRCCRSSITKRQRCSASAVATVAIPRTQAAGTDQMPLGVPTADRLLEGAQVGAQPGFSRSGPEPDDERRELPTHAEKRRSTAHTGSQRMVTGTPGPMRAASHAIAVLASLTQPWDSAWPRSPPRRSRPWIAI